MVIHSLSPQHQCQTQSKKVVKNKSSKPLEASEIKVIKSEVNKVHFSIA